MKKFFALVSAALLAACSSNPPVTITKDAEYNPATQARVRLYGQNRHKMLAWHDIDCTSPRQSRGFKVDVSVRSTLRAAFEADKNESIGIPETEISRNTGTSQNGLLNTGFFKEITVSAGLPMNVQSSMASNDGRYRRYCKTKIVSFVPKAGKDYEITGVDGKDKKWCSLAVFEIAQDGTTTPVELNARAVCSKRR